jgi:hypothetical protein
LKIIVLVEDKLREGERVVGDSEIGDLRRGVGPDSSKGLDEEVGVIV